MLKIAYLMTCYFENAPAFQNSSAYLTTLTVKNASASGGNFHDPHWGKILTTYDLKAQWGFLPIEYMVGYRIQLSTSMQYITIVEQIVWKVERL